MPTLSSERPLIHPGRAAVRPRSTSTRPVRLPERLPAHARVLAFLLLAFAGAACGDAGTLEPDPDERLRTRFDLRALDAPLPYPSDNAWNAERIELGRLLFYDPILAGEKDVSCGVCHHPSLHFADGLPLGIGTGGSGLGPGRTTGPSAISGEVIPREPRHTPTILNSAFNGVGTHEPDPKGMMLWDGNAVGLEGQPVLPLITRVEMLGDAFPADVALDSVFARLRSNPRYVELFEAAFPDEATVSPEEAVDGAVIDSSTYVRAVAAFVRELVGRDSRYDRFVRGEDDALSDVEKRGLELFFGEAKCATCHGGPMLSDFRFVVNGTPQIGPGKELVPGDDLGRMEVTGDPADRYAFKVPSLRNAALTAPYMHDGVFATLEEVVRFYDRGARPRHPEVTDDMLPPVLREPLGLSDRDVDALVAFMESLTDPGFALDRRLLTVPDSVPSGLTPVFGASAP